MGRVCYGPSLLCAEFVMGRVCYVPNLLCAELSLNLFTPNEPLKLQLSFLSLFNTETYKKPMQTEIQ